MNEAQTTETKTTTTPTTPTWTDVIAEANEPPPQTFTELISETLDEREQLQVGLQFRDARKKRERFVDQTKQIVADRKARLATIDAEVKELDETFSTGRREVEVEVTEYTSLRLGKRWKVRKDTGQHFDERALTIEEREQYAPRKNDKQLSLADAAKMPGADTASEPAYASTEDDEDQPDSKGTSITDPESLLEDASDEGDEEEDGE